MALTPPLVDYDKTDPLAIEALSAGFQFEGVLAMHLSPIVFGCSERWQSLLERIEQAYGYVYEWVPAEENLAPVPGVDRWGTAMLTYIG